MTSRDKAMTELLALWAALPISAHASVSAKRERYEALLDTLPILPGAELDETTCGGVPVIDVVADATTAGTVVHVHGGGFIMGSARGYRAYGAALACATGLRVVLVDYRKAPEHPYPAGVQDVADVLRETIARDAGAVVLTADSAGCALALSALVRLREHDSEALRAVAALVVVSPWVDLTVTASSLSRNAHDPVVTAASLRANVELYAPGVDVLADAGVSPLPHGRLDGLPPAMVMVGAEEALLDDARQLTAVLVRDGVSVEHHEVEGVPHVWPVFAPILPHGTDALREIARFIGAATSGNVR